MIQARRRTAEYRALAALLAALQIVAPATAGAWPLATARATHGATQQTTPVARLTSPGAPASTQSAEEPRAATAVMRSRTQKVATAPAVIPRRIRPRSLEVLSGPSAGDPWTWFDGSSAPGFGSAGTVAVRVTLPAPTRLVAVAAWGSSAGVLSVRAERGASTVALGGLEAIDLGRPGRPGRQADGWHTFAVDDPAPVASLVIGWDSHGGSPRELELWELGAAPGDALDPELADQLHTGLSPGAVEIAAQRAAAEIAPSARDGAGFTFELPAGPRAFERAFLVYELEGLAHWTLVPRRINDRPGPEPQRPSAFGDDPGQGGLQVEEIAPAWLRDGTNQIVFLPVPERTYRVRNARLVLVGADDVRAVRRDEGGRDWQLAFPEPAQPQHVAFQLAAPTRAQLVLAAGGKVARVDLTGLEPGWHWRAIPELPQASRVRASVAGPKAVIGELSVSASPLPLPGAPSRLVVSYPLHGECAGSEAYVRGFAGAEPVAQVHAVPRAAARRAVAVEVAAAGTPLRRTVGVGPCRASAREIADVMSPGGKRALADDPGAPFGAMVAAGEARTLSFGGATLEIPAGAIDRDVRITIRPLAPDQVRPMDDLMENVIAGKRGYRFGPLGMVFKKPVKLTLPIDAAQLPPRASASDVYSFYFHEQQRRWHRVGRIGALRPGTLTSVTEHFTDFVNATRPLPEHPVEQLFNPTTIKELKVGDPASGVELIQPPDASQSGAARLAYPLELPPARHVQTPSLALVYSSDRANGWLGAGWDLPLSVVEIDTRFGVPRYDGSERYLLDGEMLTGPDPATGEFHRRVEGRFDRIQRLGSDPTSYSWVVTDKDGTRRIYGETAAARLSDPAPDRSPVTFRWHLQRIEDVFGNRIDFSYTRDAGDNGEPWAQLYPARIDYTSHPSGLPAEYSVVFALDAGDRPDVIITGRSGFQVLTRKRLDHVDVQLAGDIIRRYALAYQAGDFGKSLLASVSLFGVGAAQQLTAHSFAYHTAPQRDGVPDVFAPLQAWGQVLRQGGAPRAEDGLSRADDRLSGGSGSIGVGFGPVSLTVGAGGFSGDDRTRLLQFDRHGDGLPDFLDDGGAGSRNLLVSRLPASGSFGAEPVTGLGPDSLGKTDRTGFTVDGGLNIGGLAGVAASYSRSTVEDTRIVADVNGDGFTDLLSADGGQVSTRLGDGNNHFGAPQPLGQLALEDIVLGNQQRRDAADASFHRIDPLTRWTAPFPGSIVLAGAIQKLAPGNAVVARIYQNGALIWTRTLTDTTACVPAPGNGCGGGLPLSIADDDRIFTQLEAVGAPAGTDVAWDPTITYQVDPALAGLREPHGPPIYRFSQRDDHRLAGRPSVAFVASASGTVSIGGTLHKLPTSDDVLVQVVKRDAHDQNSTVLANVPLAAALEASVPVTLDVPVVTGDSLTFQVVADTPIDPDRVQWRPTVTYTTYCRADRSGRPVCGAVTCTLDAQGRPVACQIAGDPFPNVPLPGDVIAQDAQVYFPVVQLLPAVPTATVLASGVVTISGQVVKGVTAAPVVIEVQGVQRLHFKRVLGADETGVFPVALSPTLGTGEQLFFTIASADDPRGAITWSPTVNGAPAPVNVRFRDPAFADPFTDEPRDPMSGGFHRWFFGDWDGEVAFDPARIVIPAPGTPSAFLFVTPLRQGTAALRAPLWVGRGDGEYIAAGQQRPARTASASSLGGNGSGGLDDLRIAETWNFNLGASVVGLGVDASTGDTTSVTDLFDVNGDRFPDAVFADGVRFNDGQGLQGKAPVAFGFDDLRFVAHRGLRARAGVQGSMLNVTDSAGEPRTLVSTGFNVGTEYSMSATQVDFADINGDGLPDHVEARPGDGGIRVRLNLGYKFGREILWPGAAWAAHSFGTRANLLRGVFGDAVGSDVVKLHDTGSNSVGVGADVGVVGGGGGVVFSASRSLVELVDLNGDGLPDQLLKVPDETGVLRVKLNLGNGFGPEQRWPIPPWAGLDVDPPDFQFLPSGDALTFHRSQQLSASFSVKVCFFVCVGATGFHSQGPEWSQLGFEDIDGDGRVDHVLKLDGNAQVYAKLNQVGKSNLLKTVTRPLGSTIELDYQRDGNRVAPGESPRVDMPQNQWVLASVVTSDGRGNQYREAFDYTSSGVFDRVEREWYGYAHIITTHVDDGSRLEQFFYNQDYYRKGLTARSILEDAAGKLFAVRDVTLRVPPASLPPITGSFFPAEASRTSSFYEGTTTQIAQPGKTITEERDFDDTGNLVSLIDRGEPGPDDDLLFSVTWRRDAGTHIMRPERVQARDGTGALLRDRRSTYRGDGTLDALTDVVVGGKDPDGQPYTGDGDRNLTWRFAYDGVGNLVSVTDPATYMLGYEYDARMRQFATAVTDSFGYRSTSVPDYRFATITERTDVNGQKLRQELDAFGRLVRVFGPDDLSSSEPTVRYDYGLQPGEAPFPAWAATRNKDDTRPGDPLTTVTFVDGLSRVLQVKKDAELDTGGATAIGMIVSGRVEFDPRGRLAAQGQPVFDTGPDAAFVDVPLKNPTRLDYDILSRQRQITTPDGARAQVEYGFGVLDGATLFRETATDPLGEVRTALRSVRNELAAMQERNTIAGQLTTLVTRYRHDALGQLTAAIDARGNVTTAELDTVGRMVAVTSLDAGRTEMRYDPTGTLGAKQTANLRAGGDLVRYRYTYDRLEQIDYPDHPPVRYMYGSPSAAGDASGNQADRVAIEESEAGRKERRFDRLGNVISEVTDLVNPDHPDAPFHHQTDYRYDSLGRLLEMTFPGIGREVVSYGYDAGGQVTSAHGTYTRPADLQPGTPVDTAYLDRVGYDEFGQRVRMRYGNGIETRYSYDPVMHRLAAVDADNQDGFMRQQGLPARPFQRLRYRYDLVGNVVELKNDIPVPDVRSSDSMQIGPAVQTFHYDHLYQLTGADGLYRAEAKEQFRSNLSLGYDAIGNIVTKNQLNQREDQADGGLQIHQVDDTTYTFRYRYDGPRPHAPTVVADPIENPPPERVTSLAYDADGNQLTRFDGLGHTIRQQQWDSEDRLKEVDAPSGKQVMLYDAGGVRSHSFSDPKLNVYINQYLTFSDEHIQSKHIYVGDLRIATKVEPQEGTRPQVLFYHSDQLQSTHVVSDQDQFLTEHDEYFASGEVWVEEGIPSDFTTPHFLFNGKELDPATGYGYFGARYYDARLSQWISPDPALGEYMRGDPQAGGIDSPRHLGLYTYTLNNPVILRDPTGRQESVGEPGFGESLIPIWGSGRSAIDHFQKGNWVRGSLFTVLAVTDVFLVKSLVTAGGKVLIKGGAKLLVEEGATSGEKALVQEGVTATENAALKEGGEVANTAVAEGAKVAERRVIGETGEVGESVLREMGGTPHAFRPTTLGARFIDQLVNGIAHESKVGYTSLTPFVRRQIAKDTELMATKQIQGATWHFFKSPVTGRVGPSGPLRQALEKAGIGIVIH
ncbi:MAG TPA: SpvB/TcaC N-terminal domain-containing protein [Kofleriaceae bacterium]|nr:SpvB/TcaC N-terminal domain-containing protein [Kofleriaceae bacterium]